MAEGGPQHWIPGRFVSQAENRLFGEASPIIPPNRELPPAIDNRWPVPLAPDPPSRLVERPECYGINDGSEIVGQGLFDGQEQAFVLNPDEISAPEPSTLLIFGLMAGAVGLRAGAHASRKGAAA
jgi:hypothetical protein